MDTEEEFRRSRLKDLVKKLGRGAIARISEGLECNPSYVSRMLSDPSTNQHRPVSAETVLALEKLYPGWLLPLPDTQTPVTGAESSKPVTLTEDENRILAAFRVMLPDDRARILSDVFSAEAKAMEVEKEILRRHGLTSAQQGKRDPIAYSEKLERLGPWLLNEPEPPGEKLKGRASDK